MADGPEAQNELFKSNRSLAEKNSSLLRGDLPDHLKRSSHRLQFPPSYALVGVYRLCTDQNLYVPVWQKCQHGTVRGAAVGIAWAFFTFGIQKKFIEIFLANSHKVTGLATDTIFGYPVPFNVHTYAAVLLVGQQITYILRFFLSRNIRIARDRAWNQTVASRGKGEDFWQPYTEEWDQPPKAVHSAMWYEQAFSNWFLFMFKKALLLPFNFYPLVGILISAWFKGMGTARILHRRYFEAKKMTPDEVAIFMEEHKWDYRTFGFTAALLEGFPIIGLVFTISNRVGAAMWAFDLEKRQHYVAEKKKDSVTAKKD
ncbi:uncharacterized protein C8R40DRAFT_1040812 [Lentinula edodes]|uniref:uncharacterized protein n=1 Tax=Lentinula edodes TaxID=5353 RepID=UPI001E8D933C|nr:uncharacterized protein C8R40DRAFT_1040812 [Lentinula edodes]KAH7877398.1 hypothetical protein C8R40DRAFT_1040812 [Lentinula edodes]